MNDSIHFGVNMLANLKVAFIDNQDIFNIIHRDIPAQNKNTFLIYDVGGNLTWRKNVIHVCNPYEELTKNNQVTQITSKDLLQLIKDEEQKKLMSEFKLYFNIIAPFEKNSPLQTYIYKQFHTTFEKGIIQFEELVQKFDIIIKDNPLFLEDINYRNFLCSIKLFQILKIEKCRELFISLESIEQFLLSYPFMKEQMINRQINDNHVKLYPNEIIKGKLFLGDINQAKDLEILTNLGITHIINVTDDVDCYFENQQGFSYLKNSIQDLDECQIEDFFDQSFDFINQAIGEKSPEGQKIFVHCAQGKSRSASIVIMYLMRQYNMRFEQALNYVKDRREKVNPNYGFKASLQNLEKQLFSQKIVENQITQNSI